MSTSLNNKQNQQNRTWGAAVNFMTLIILFWESKIMKTTENKETHDTLIFISNWENMFYKKFDVVSCFCVLISQPKPLNYFIQVEIKKIIKSNYFRVRKTFVKLKKTEHIEILLSFIAFINHVLNINWNR